VVVEIICSIHKTKNLVLLTVSMGSDLVMPAYLGKQLN